MAALNYYTTDPPPKIAATLWETENFYSISIDVGDTRHNIFFKTREERAAWIRNTVSNISPAHTDPHSLNALHAELAQIGATLIKLGHELADLEWRLTQTGRRHAALLDGVEGVE